MMMMKMEVTITRQNVTGFIIYLIEIEYITYDLTFNI